MNNTRRKEIGKVINQLEDLRDKVDELLSEEQEYLDNIPDNFQCSDRYCKAEESVEYLQSAYDSLDEVVSSLESSME